MLMSGLLIVTADQFHASVLALLGRMAMGSCLMLSHNPHLHRVRSVMLHAALKKMTSVRLAMYASRYQLP